MGPLDGDGFSFSSFLQIRVRLTDGYLSGDAFDLFVFANGSSTPQSTHSTPHVPFGNGDIVNDADPDVAFTDPDLSKVDFLLDPGTYIVTLAVREDAGFLSGDGFLRVDEVPAGPNPPVSDTPEPSTLLLLGSGLAGIGAFARRRIRERANA